MWVIESVTGGLQLLPGNSLCTQLPTTIATAAIEAGTLCADQVYQRVGHRKKPSQCPVMRQLAKGKTTTEIMKIVAAWYEGYLARASLYEIAVV
jgi:hypothetical protein